MAVDHTQSRQIAPAARYGGERTVSKDHFDVMAPGVLEDAGAVITMFVSDENGGKILYRQTEPRKPQLQLARAEAAVEQQPGIAGFDNQRIAAAAAAKRGKTHGAADYFN